MNRASWRILAVVFLMMALSAGLLWRLKASQKLGNPGLKVVPQALFDPSGKEIAKQSVFLPEKVLDYTSTLLPVTAQELNWLPRDTTYGRRLYRGPDGFEMQLSIVLMGSDRTSIHKPQYCLEGQGFAIDDSEIITLPVGGPKPYEVPVMKMLTTKPVSMDGKRVNLRGVYLYWFVSENQLTASHAERMWWMARDLIQKRTLQRWAYVTYFAVCLPGQESMALDRMRSFVAATVPEFQATGLGAEGARGPSEGRP
jgi:EpsI family protein